MAKILYFTSTFYTMVISILIHVERIVLRQRIQVYLFYNDFSPHILFASNISLTWQMSSSFLLLFLQVKPRFLLKSINQTTFTLLNQYTSVSPEPLHQSGYVDLFQLVSSKGTHHVFITQFRSRVRRLLPLCLKRRRGRVQRRVDRRR